MAEVFRHSAKDDAVDLWQSFDCYHDDADDLTAGLFAPVEMLIVENESGDGSIVIYDVPSSLMRIENNPAMLEAAHALDSKLQTLVSRVTGVEPSN